MAHQHAQRDGRIGIARIADRIAQIGADIFIRRKHAVVHHLHQPNARHQLRDRRTAEITLFRHGNAGRLLLHAVIMFIHDLAILRDKERAADRFRIAEYAIHALIHALFRRRKRQREDYRQRDRHAHDSLQLNPLL